MQVQLVAIVERVCANQYSHESNFIDFKDKVLLPSFIALHIHTPQWPQAGLALDDELSHWLNSFTFPLESKYKDINYAREVYTNLVKKLLANGTTSAMYFGTIHNESTLELAKICANLGQRGFVGKVVMDDETMNPDFYRDNSTKEAISFVTATSLFIAFSNFLANFPIISFFSF